MANEFKVRKGLIVQGSGSNIFDVQGSQGQLFSITDSLSGSLFAVNDISGIPIMEVFSDNTIKMGTFNQEAIIVSGSRTGMGIATPQAELHISGANNDSLFRIQSPASASIMFVSGSGLVGIGTATPTQKISVDNGNVGFTNGFGISWDSDTEWIRRAAASDQLQLATQNTVRLNIGSTQGQLVTIGLGATTGTAQFQVRGGGATAASTAMRIEDSGGNARLTILDDGTSAFNTSHLYVSSSGRIGIGTATPTIGVLDINGIGRIRSSNQLYFGGTGAGDWQGAISGQASGLLVNANLVTINNSGYASPATQSFVINTSQNVAIGPHSPTARLHVSGASNAVLFEIDSPAVNNIIYVSGSGNVGIGTGTPTNTLQVVGGITATSITSSLLGTASVAVTAQTASFLPTGTYSITSSWATNALTASFVNTTNTNAFVQNGNSFGATALLGTNDNQNLQLETSGSVRVHIGNNGNVGIGTTSPTERLHVSGNIYTEDNLIIPSGKDIMIRDVVDDTTGTIICGTYDRSGTDPNFDYVSTSSIFLAGLTNTRIDLFGTNTTYIGGLPNFGRMLFTIPNSGNALFSSPSNANILFVSGSGNVGIGTATPVHNLVVNGSTGVSINANGAIFPNIHRDSADGGMLLRSWNGSTFTNNVKITPTNEVGIGTTSPTAELHVSGANADSLFRVSSPSATSALFVSGSGLVGIGTTTPGERLHVAGNIRLDGTRYIDWGSGNSRITDLGVTAGQGYPITISTFGPIGTGTSNTLTEKLRLTGSGSLGLGTTSPSARFHISGGFTDGNLMRVQSPTGAEYFFISASGNVGIGTTTPTQRLDVRGNTIIAGTTPINPVGGTLEVYNNGSNAVLTIHEDSGSAEARLAFRTEGSDTIFRNLNTRFSIDAETKSDALTLSLGGRVGIGTSTATPSSLLQVRGEGATSATTAFRVENSNQDPELTVLDNGNVGISTATPSDLLTINSPSSTGSLRLTHLTEIETLRATSFHSALYIGNNLYYNGSGDPVTNSSYAVDSGSNNRGGNLLLMRANNGTTSLGGFYFYTALSSSIANTTATLTENLRILPSASVFSNTRVGIGAAANTSYAFDVASSAPNAGAARINGNNTVWLFNDVAQVSRGTTSINRMVQMNMGPVNASSGVQSLLVLSQSINQSSTAGYTTLVVNANQTGTGSGNKLLQAWQFNGTNLTVINNSGSLGVGTATPNGVIDVFQGGNSRILVTTDNGFVGLQQSSPAEYIHITSDPSSTKYLQIDAAQASNPPPRYLPTVPAKELYGQTADDYALGTPDYWMEIILNGNTVLIPCYTPGP